MILSCFGSFKVTKKQNPTGGTEIGQPEFVGSNPIS